MANHITSIQYQQFLNALKVVAEEKNRPLLQEPEIVDVNNPLMNRMLSAMPSFNQKDVIQKIASHSMDPLFLYEAATRANLPTLADVFVKQWFEEVEKIDNGRESPEQKIANLKNKILLPDFSKRTEAEALLKGRLQNHILAKEIVYQHFHPEEARGIPEHVSKILCTVEPSPDELLVISKYVHLQKGLSFTEGSKSSLTNSMVKTFLARFPELETLDLSDCVQITKSAFSHGHQKLKKLILTGTEVNPEKIDRSRFPLLQEVVQEKQKVVLNLDQTFNSNRYPRPTIDWIALYEETREAEEIVISDKTFYAIESSLKEGYEDHRLIQLQWLTLLLKKASVVTKPFLYPHRNWKEEMQADFRSKVFEEILEKYKEIKEEDWKDPHSQLAKLWIEAVHGKMLEEGALENPPAGSYRKVNKPATEMILKELSLTIKSKKQNMYRDEMVDSLAYVDEKKIAAVRCILRSLLTYQGSIYFTQVVENLKDRMKELDRKRFFSKDEKRGHEVRDREFLSEVFVEICHTVDGLIDFGPFAHLKNPEKEVYVKECITNASLIGFAILLNPLLNERIPAGKGYKLTLEHTLASALALTPKNSPDGLSHREAMLEELFKNFEDYENDSDAYPFQKILLGVLEEKDIPEWDQESLLKGHLLAYKGVVHELISPELKEKYWHAILEGKLGGKTLHLIDALFAYYNKPHAADDIKDRIRSTLKEFAGYHKGFLSGHYYANPLETNPFVLHARAKFDEIRNYR